MTSAEKQSFLCVAVEPIHIGGGSPDPGTGVPRIAADVDGVPFIPPTSLKGAIRAVTSVDTGVQGCDGKGLDCPQPHRCASCAVFGYTNFHHGRQSASLLRFSPGSLSLVPIQTTKGLIWITSPERLLHATIIQADERDRLIDLLSRCPGLLTNEVWKLQADEMRTRFGIHFQRWNGEWRDVSTQGWQGKPQLSSLLSHAMVVNDAVFTAVAQSDLASTVHVAIDAATGSPRNGSLFRVDGVKRLSVISFEVLFYTPKLHGLTTLLNTKDGDNPELKATIDSLENIVNSGFGRLRVFGIGGKRTRGFGRLDIWPIGPRSVVASIAEQPYPTVRPRVFVSYSSTNKSLARRLAADLQSEGIDVWLDDHEIFVGDSIHQKVGQGIEDCDHVVLLLSRAAVKSDWVIDEVHAAMAKEKLQRRKILLPVTLEELSEEEIPPLVRDRHRAFLHRGYDEGVRKLIRAIRHHASRAAGESATV